MERGLYSNGGKSRHGIELITLCKTVKRFPGVYRRDRRPVSSCSTKVLNEWMNERPSNARMNEPLLVCLPPDDDVRRDRGWRGERADQRKFRKNGKRKREKRSPLRFRINGISVGGGTLFISLNFQYRLKTIEQKSSLIVVCMYVCVNIFIYELCKYIYPCICIRMCIHRRFF